MHHKSQCLVKLILSLPASPWLERLEAKEAGTPPPSEGHTWVGSELRDYGAVVEPNSFTADSHRPSVPMGLGLGHTHFGVA